jgi:xanthine dehydrogenase accessory factor
MLIQGRSASDLRRFALGPSLGQCCGGNTQLLFEVAAPLADFLEPLRGFATAKMPSVLASPIDGVTMDKTLVTAETVIGAVPPDGLVVAAKKLLHRPFNAGARSFVDADGRRHLLEQTPGRNGHILLIGAGHVGKAVAHILGTLPFAVTWADNRPDQYPDDIAANITVRCTPHLERAVDEAPADTIYLVMTYSHDLDYALCARVLERGDFRYLGLIGSTTKRARFEKTMADLGIEPALVERVVCPIGIEGIGSKQPAVIAVATAAQILALPAREERDP